ncbi:hypothetical protein KHF85_02075 [Xanthomonas translucens pv. graminis]|uniref:hypothetical protein n=1 Tax=Xanthomonas graminis TaxID=3390026 RepID=UPI00253FB159|nr:hypothetical protein [Xanthomonas translucens]WIH05331.1 hypothetical protein KHF85_02075 [Xanthomonas translucens pv. graminis]
MDNIAFFFRNKLSENRFSDSVLAALSTPSIDSALLCSGFFQEDSSYSVSAKRFSSISRCCHKIDLTTVGYYKGGKPSYTAFNKGIAKHCCNTCINHKPLRLPGDKWHAKIFIGKTQGEPVIAAIGSSNLTRRAFDTKKNFNYECDVLFWDGSNKLISSRISTILGESPDESMSIVVAKVDYSHPVNRVPVTEKLKELEREILSKAVLVV